MFSSVPLAPKDPVFSVNERAKADKDPNTINLVIGAYRDENGKPYVLPVVREAERRIIAKNLDKEYLNIDGDPEFCKASARIAFGDDCDLTRICAVQTLSGTGAVSLAALTLRRIFPDPTKRLLISDPTWANHENVFRAAGFDVGKYRYFNSQTKGVAIDNMIADIRAAPKQSIILLHQCAHNPTGADPSHEEWERILDCIVERGHIPLLDNAYQGYASGDLDKDAFCARLFYRRGVEFLVGQSYAKNMGLYGERCGCLCIVTSNQDARNRIQGLIKLVIRSIYSSPPAHSARIAAEILTTPALKAQWIGELKLMSGRILKMRQLLYNELVRLGTPGTWTHITKQIGMFSYLGLLPGEAAALEKRHVYLLEPGRISIAGLTEKNVPIFAAALDAVVRSRKRSSL